MTEYPELPQAVSALLPAEVDFKELGCSLDLLCSELLRWNQIHNLSGHHSAPEVYDNLFSDAAALLPWIRGKTLLDIGSGAGFPGLALALYVSDLQVVLLEPRAKRNSFQKHVVRLLGLEQRVRPVMARAGEALPDEIGHFSTVTLRAVAGLNESLQLALPYLEPVGRVLLPRGAKDRAEALEMGLRVEEYSQNIFTGDNIIVLAQK